MKKILPVFCLLASVVFAQVKHELRGVWVTNVASNVLSTDKNIADAMKLLAQKGFNVVFPVVWNKGYTLYPSQVMNTHFGIPIDPVYGTRDPLDKIVIEAHRNGMEIMPWFEYGFSPGFWGGGTPVDSGFILQKYPAWGAADNTGALLIKNGFIWMSGINPEVQNFMLSLMTEVLDKYDVDGVQGDDRLPAMPIEGGYDEATKTIYRAENNGTNPPLDYQNNNWKKWRANKLNRFLSRARDSVKARGQNIILSVAPNPYPWGYDNYLQDAKTWVDSGMIDNYIPQLYRQTLPDYTATLNSAVSYVPSSKKSITFAGVLAKAGTYTVTPDLLVNMVKANRGAGINGESYFFYEAFPLNNNKLADTLRNSVYKENALLPYRNGNVYRPKPKMILETDNANVVKNGSWTQNVIAAFDSVSYMAESTAPASITYFDTFTYAAWFDVYTYAVPNFSFTKNARFTLYGDTDSSVVVVNQQDTKNSGWIKLGSVYLNPGRKRFLKIDNGLVEPGKLLFADASFCMINRKKSPDVIITTTERIAVIIPNAPERDSLFYSYPNPFNQQTVIRFSIAEPSHVSLIVYNILGKTVELLLDQILEAGYYERYYRPDNLASGMYICRFKTKHETRSVKMLMLK